MLRTIMLVLALIILIVIGLFYLGILSWPGGNRPVEVNPVEVKMEMKNVQVPTPVIRPGNQAEPAPAQ